MQLYIESSKPHSAPIIGLSFSTLCEDDIALVLAMRNDERVARFMYASSISPQAHREFIASLADNPSAKYWLFKCGEIVLGVGSLSRISLSNAHAYLGIYTNPFLSKAQKHALCENSAFESVGAMILAALEQAGRELGLHTIFLEVLDSNAHARAFYERNGYDLQGRLREFVRVGRGGEEGGYGDVCLYGKVFGKGDSAFSGRDSALRDKSPILRRGLAHYRLGKSLRPRLESGDFSSQILESQSSCENWACGLESQGGITKQADNKTTASEKSAESKKVDSSDNTFLSSLRADLSAWQSTQKSTTPLESTFSHNATQTHKADSKEKMDCHADLQSARNDSKKADSRENAQKLNNSQAAKQAKRSFFRKQAKRSFFRKQATAVQGGSTKASFFSKAESHTKKPTPSPPPLLIAEISANHNQSLRLAKHTIKAAKIAGADFVKLQTYTPECLSIACDKPRFRIDSGTLWDGESLYTLYQKAHTPLEWHKELFSYARGLGVGIFSSPFSAKALELLESLECPMYKIASFEITDTPFIKLVASTKKPIIISTGIATHEEILEALQACYEAGNDDITLLLCTSSYPAPLQSAQIASMPKLARYGVKYGLSDHTQGDLCAILASALGASMIEKHFIIRRSLGGIDAEFSMEAREFQALARKLQAAHLALGSGNLASKLESNASSSGRGFARSLFVCEDVRKGELLTPSNIRSIRPSGGLSPKFLPEVLGKRAARDLEKGEPLEWGDFI